MNLILEIQSSQQQALHFLLDFLKQQQYQFTAITPLSHQRILDRKRSEKNKRKTLQDIFGWNLEFTITDLDPVLFSLLLEHQLLEVKNNAYKSLIRVASLEDELFIHSAFPTTQQDAVFFGPDTYRFAYHLKQYLSCQANSFKRAAEICCGTSAAAIHMAKHFPDHKEIFVADLNPKALLYSQINIDFSGFDTIHPVQSNLFSDLEGQFDLIFANPPYLIDPDQRQYRHGGNELDGNELSFKIIKQGLQRLSPDGRLFLYTGVTICQDGNRFLQHLEDLMKQHQNLDWSYEEIDPDIFGEELEQPAYQHVERIALALLKFEVKTDRP